MTGKSSDPQKLQKRPPKLPRPYPFPNAVSPKITEALADISDNRISVTDFWAQNQTSPVIEHIDNECLVTFLFRHETATSVLLFANRLTDETNLTDTLLTNAPHTDIWHLTVKMPTDWQASYCFLTQEKDEPSPWVSSDGHVGLRQALDKGISDPLNPVRTVNRLGTVMSIVTLPDAPDRTPFTTPQTQLPEYIAPGQRKCWIYKPNTENETPLLLLLDGDAWAERLNLPGAIDSLIKAGKIPPITAVFIDSISRENRWEDLLHNGIFPNYLVSDLLPWARETLNVSNSSHKTIIAGQSLGGLTALKTVLSHPDKVGVAIAQSPSLWADNCEEELRHFRKHPAHNNARIYQQVGSLEWALIPHNREFIAQTKSLGINIDYSEYTGGHDYACWGPGILQSLILATTNSEEA